MPTASACWRAFRDGLLATWASILTHWDRLELRGRGLVLAGAVALLVVVGRVTFGLHAHNLTTEAMAPALGPSPPAQCDQAYIPAGCVRQDDHFCLQAQATANSPAFVYGIRMSGMSLVQAPGASMVTIRLTRDQAGTSATEKARVIQVADAYLAYESPPVAPIYVDGPAALCLAAWMHKPSQ